ncbi:MAG: response regulator [Mangrovibacterium sp.]
MIKVMITDDHRILVDGLRKLVDDSGFARVCGTAYTGKACMTLLAQVLPDVLFLDINLPDCSGLDLCKQIKASYPSVKIVAITSYGEYAVVREMMGNGASGYVLKNAMPEEILLSIQMVHENETFLCEQIDLLMRKRSVNPVWLTPREKELLSFIAGGYTNSEIADKMFLSVETVNSYRKNLLCKLGARNTAVLVKIALEQKLIR